MNNSEETKKLETVEAPFMKRTVKLMSYDIPYWVIAMIMIMIVFAIYYFYFAKKEIQLDVLKNMSITTESPMPTPEIIRE